MKYLLLIPLLMSCHGGTQPLIPQAQASASQPVRPPTVEECLVSTAYDEVGVMEEGWNAGARIVEYQASTRAAKGTPYCASGVHWAFRQCGRVIEPHWEFAAAARWARENEVFRKGQLDMYQHIDLGHEFQRISQNSDVFTLWYANLKRVGHCGIVVGEDEDYLITVEWNTNAEGAREGGGVWMRKRSKDAIHSVNRWVR